MTRIANSLTEPCGQKTFQISGFWPDDERFANQPVKSLPINLDFKMNTRKTSGLVLPTAESRSGLLPQME